ncbi:hypothetical protein [Sediminicoccus sp. KRV36]|uniref:hypothetical protein n=1 Tax=Sediminicoccus sp. KRV36 TaxID=3133721 RepID=UPI00200CCE2B|nr:hypothetical protein [Sediminicoccus rosea]UPY36512.1 hypothetical protein LHU95_20180 [Sediminicoccus rosea]
MTTGLNNLPLISKLLLALGLMVLVGLGGGYHAVTRMAATDALYSRLLHQNARAALHLARANIALIDDGRVLNRMVTETTPSAIRGSMGELAAIHARVAEMLAIAEAAMPSIAAELRDITND